MKTLITLLAVVLAQTPAASKTADVPSSCFSKNIGNICENGNGMLVNKKD